MSASTSARFISNIRFGLLANTMSNFVFMRTLPPNSKFASRAAHHFQLLRPLLRLKPGRKNNLGPKSAAAALKLQETKPAKKATKAPREPNIAVLAAHLAPNALPRAKRRASRRKLSRVVI